MGLEDHQRIYVLYQLRILRAEPPRKSFAVRPLKAEGGKVSGDATL